MAAADDPRPGDFHHHSRILVRWGDMDTLHHVNNARYFTFEETSRVEYFQPLAIDDPRMWKDYGLILASIGAEFRSQLRYPAEVDVGTRVARIGRSSMDTVSGLFVGTQLVAVVRGVVVWFDYLQQKPLAIPQEVRDWIVAREVIKPQV